jgi:hypothetical protein
VNLSCGPHQGTGLGPVQMNRRTTVVQHVRDLRGRNRSALVKAANGRHYVRKALDAFGDSDLLFNEAFASQLGSALALSFPDWAELIGCNDDVIHPVSESTRLSRPSFFGSELVSGDLVEYLPGTWYAKVRNRIEAYCCLLFDLWCNHADARQAVYQDRGSHSFHMYFVDHDQLFAAEERDSIQQRIAQTRYLDLRLYKQPVESVQLVLRPFAAQIDSLASNELEIMMAGIPSHWGSAEHRQSVVCALKRRSRMLGAYIDSIVEFARAQAQTGSGLGRL